MILVKFTRHESGKPVWVNYHSVTYIFEIDDSCTSIGLGSEWMHVTEDAETVMERLIYAAKTAHLPKP